LSIVLSICYAAQETDAVRKRAGDNSNGCDPLSSQILHRMQYPPSAPGSITNTHTMGVDIGALSATIFCRCLPSCAKGAGEGPTGTAALGETEQSELEKAVDEDVRR